MERYAPDLQTFVRTPLAERHVARLREAGAIVSFPAGAAMIDLETVPTPFLSMLSGEAAPFDAVTGEPYSESTLGRAQFAGELRFWTGGRSLLVTRASQDVTAIRVARDVMLRLMAEEPEMSDVIITGFAARAAAPGLSRRACLNAGSRGRGRRLGAFLALPSWLILALQQTHNSPRVRAHKSLIYVSRLTRA